MPESQPKTTPPPWEHGQLPSMSFDEMRSSFAQIIKATLDYFGGDVLNRLQVVTPIGSEDIVCIVGISPSAPYNAALIVRAVNEYAQLRANLECLKTLLSIAAPEFCSMKCPSVWPTELGSQPHTEECTKIRTALAEVIDRVAQK